MHNKKKKIENNKFFNKQVSTGLVDIEKTFFWLRNKAKNLKKFGYYRVNYLENTTIKNNTLVNFLEIFIKHNVILEKL